MKEHCLTVTQVLWYMIKLQTLLPGMCEGILSRKVRRGMRNGTAQKWVETGTRIKETETAQKLLLHLFTHKFTQNAVTKLSLTNLGSRRSSTRLFLNNILQ